MGEKIKVIIIIVLVAILAVSIFINWQTYGLKKTLEQQLGYLKAENDSLNKKTEEMAKDNQRLVEKISALNKDLDKISQEKEGLQKQKKELQKQYELIVKERDNLIEKLKTLPSLKETEDKLDAIKSKNVVLRRQLHSLNTSKVKLAKKLGQLNTEKAHLERKVTELEQYLSERTSNINNAGQQLNVISSSQGTQMPQSEKEFIELPPIIVRPQPAKTTSQDIVVRTRRFGTILAVNRENNFVIIDLGEDSGIRVGEAFQVYRAEELIATIEVIQTRKSIAACDIKKETTPIQVGDTIR